MLSRLDYLQCYLVCWEGTGSMTMGLRCFYSYFLEPNILSFIITFSSIHLGILLGVRQLRCLYTVCSEYLLCFSNPSPYYW